ncbi:hypothetical protein ACFLT1_00925 [Bacteroidota bacterium]
MSVTIKPVLTKKEMKAFIHLPAKIHKDHKNWVPPLYGDEWVFFNPKKNALFKQCDYILLLAYRGKEIVGRIMGLVHHEYNTLKNENNARFNFLEAPDDREVIEALMNAIKEWARERGKEKLIGPMAFSDKDPQGYLVEGFEQPVVIASHCNFEYIVTHLKDLGFEKELDLVVYNVLVPDSLPEFHERVAERAIRNNPGLTLVEPRNRRQLRKYIYPVFTLVNETFTGIYGFTPFTREEMKEFANRYILVMDAAFVKIIKNENGDLVAFILGMPDISEGIKKSKGYLFPFGFIPVLTSGKKSKQLNLLLGAVHPDYQNRGLNSIMGIAMLKSAMKAGKTHIDSHLEMETNTKVRAEMERMGGDVYKRYRIFQQKI